MVQRPSPESSTDPVKLERSGFSASAIAAGSGIKVADTARGQNARAADVIPVIRIAAVDDGVAGRHAIGQSRHALFGRLTGREHDPDGAWLVQFPEQVQQ